MKILSDRLGHRIKKKTIGVSISDIKNLLVDQLWYFHIQWPRKATIKAVQPWHQKRPPRPGRWSAWSGGGTRCNPAWARRQLATPTPLVTQVQPGEGQWTWRTPGFLSHLLIPLPFLPGVLCMRAHQQTRGFLHFSRNKGGKAITFKIWKPQAYHQNI